MTDALTQLRAELRAAADTRTAEQIEIDSLRRELDHFIKSGIIEIAVRNPSVAEYMAHWEGRAEAAEARVTALEKGLEPFAGMLELFEPDESHFEDNELVLFRGDHDVTYGDFRRARALLNPKEGSASE